MSEIWDEYEKLVLASEEAGKTPKDRMEDFVKNDKRSSNKLDSIKDDAISLLYGINLDSEFLKYDYSKKENIIDAAHPETALSLLSYDPMNAVIENENQRQAITSFIARKEPTGTINARRYVSAKEDLVGALVRTGFLLDSNKEIKLSILNDSCIEKIAKDDRELKKQARFATKALTGSFILGASVLLGTAWYLIYGPTTAQNVAANCLIVLDKLNDLQDRKYANGIRSDITNLLKSSREIYSLKDELGDVSSVDAVLSSSQKSNIESKIKRVNYMINSYINHLKRIQDAIPEWVSKIKLTHSFDDNDSDTWAKIKGIVNVFTSTDSEELIDSLVGKKINPFSKESTGGLQGAIKEDLVKMRDMLNSAKRDVENMDSKIKENNTQKNVALTDDESDIGDDFKVQGE